eukprot:14293226-Alexandrium_andersonii.AAC.1
MLLGLPLFKPSARGRLGIISPWSASRQSARAIPSSNGMPRLPFRKGSAQGWALLLRRRCCAPALLRAALALVPCSGHNPGYGSP